LPETTTKFLEFGLQTYYALGRIVVLRASKAESRRLRVGIDPDSFDHSVLSRAEFSECGERVEFVNLAYSHVPAAVMARHIDAAIWHLASAGIPLAALKVAITPPRSDKTIDLLKDLSSACLVYCGNDPAVQSVLRRLDTKIVCAAVNRSVEQAIEDESALLSYFSAGAV
jgi:hypothetical protein